MIVMSLKLDNIYSFNNFEIDFSFPKKPVKESLIGPECLSDRPRFRYKKALILMGANATGKTILGRALLNIFKYMQTGNTALLLEMTGDNSPASFTIDFVNNEHMLKRLSAVIEPTSGTVKAYGCGRWIKEKDSYEICARDLELMDPFEIGTMLPDGIRHMHDAAELRDFVGSFNYRFAYPDIDQSMKLDAVDEKEVLRTLRAVIGTLDPSLKNISVSKELKNSYIIRRKEEEIIIQEGQIHNKEALSRGTIEGIDVAVFLAAMRKKGSGFYYCDEHFSYIQSDIEKRIFGLMVERIGTDGQLIFTTHNTDMLDLNLPKHSFAFLRKEQEGDDYRISVMYASDLLKRNTDSVRSAAENDMFMSLPDDSLLDALEVDDE